MVSEFRKTDANTPVVLMGYANPVEAMGYEVFATRAKASGVDGVLTVDYPPEESEAWVEQLNKQDIDAIFLMSPTTLQSRMQHVAKLAQGYVYYVSLKGVTGSSNLNLAEVADMLAQLRENISIPIGVGFGIRDGATAKAVSELADAVVVGSRIIEEIEQSPKADILSNVGRLLSLLRHAIDQK